jgi:hypothetical protein
MRRIMKHTLIVVTFVVGALCFAMFMITVKSGSVQSANRASPRTAN